MPKGNPQDFYLYERKRAGKPSVWYARFRSGSGTVGSPVCTEQLDRQAAMQWAIKRLTSNATPPLRKPKAKTFEEWAAPWWRFETCPYIREKIANGFNISKAYAESRRCYLDQHLVPEFGKRLLSELTPAMFRDYKMRLLSEGKYAPGTINKIIGTARIMFSYSFTMGELETNPVAPVKELKETPRERGTVTPDELARLFGPAAKAHIWNGELRHYTLNLIAASTGLRLGECQALRVQDIDRSGFLSVRHSWDDRYGMNAPKWNSTRIVTLARPAREAIEDLLALCRWGDPLPEDVLFWGVDRVTPLTKTSILKQFKAALSRIGITEEKRAQRNLVFHSWRHGFNSYLRGKVPDEQLHRVTGHRSEAMTDRYDHVRLESLRDVLAVQDKLFSFEAQEALVAGIRAPEGRQEAAGVEKGESL
jgi:integrase